MDSGKGSDATRFELWLYHTVIWLLSPLNDGLAKWFCNRADPNSVLHISRLVHIPHRIVGVLRQHGMKADYLAIGPSDTWDQCDFHFISSGRLWQRALRPWREFVWMWRVIAKYEVIHLHFALTLSLSGWELPILKRMGRKIVVHYRGCELRDREQNMALHPEINICQRCDYHAAICQGSKARVARAQQYGDVNLVTTPDLQDFLPQAEHFPFFAPVLDEPQETNQSQPRPHRDAIKIVHATNHPGIEGTEEIQAVIRRLQKKGYKIRFVFLCRVAPQRVLQEFRDADLTIGKMKMGYYANAQIESLALGVPAITYVRPEFITESLRNSGFIFTDLNHLEAVTEYYLRHPLALREKQRIARSSILRLHNNDYLGKKLMLLYAKTN